MRVFSNFPHEVPDSKQFSVVTLGVFDGLHVGHRKILETTLEVAAGEPTALVTFDPHPRSVLGPPKRARLLSPIDERLQLLAEWPLAAVAILRFDQQIARMSYEDFVRENLLQGLGARHLVLGYNVALGHERKGDQERLQALGRQLGYELTIVPAVEVDGQPVSSTRIRRQLDAGQVEAATALLGRPYSLEGTVVRGSGRGRVLGIPTANLQLHPDKLVPANGVYAVHVEVGSTRHGGALNIGVAPTFRTDGARTIEVLLLDYTGDLYGARIRLHLVRHLRSERRFEAPEALVAQVRKDVEAARRALKL